MKTVLLTAGGTGGHIFPAEALAGALARRRVRVVLLTDERGLKFGERFAAAEVISVASGTYVGRSLSGKVLGALKLGLGFVQSVLMIARKKPDVAVGFGGYPTVPPLLAAALWRKPLVLHEQNAVLGRANRFVSRFARVVATGFSLHNSDDAALPMIYTGNPVRQAVLDVRDTPYVQPDDKGAIHITVFGGSQGAKVMSDVVAPALCGLPDALKARLSITQQARLEDLDTIRNLYENAGVRATVAAFFVDLPERLANTHLVICRSGASTLAELAVLGRPSILVPLPGAVDQDQAMNAKHMSDVGGAVVLPQADLTPLRLQNLLVSLFDKPAMLSLMAQNAHKLAAVDAAERLADVVMRVLDECNE